ncbi:FtsQ-type POTRA domain-containing protein [Sphingomonas parva]|uniref:Cell division protein FtsQ n=1 Tax=Sphingomonas parva TaxID=2555898 RepID=A0A4Y8ZS41_9SPHN|nr:cell division protein FtsQ/DivIB [Sphingomonas parva]TFI57945.1 FtsQ-type POTRA domain-containing protein [Sphingomonas parva]
MSAKIARGAAAPRPRPKNKAPARGGRGRKGAAEASQLPEAVRRVSWFVLIGMLAALAIALLAAFRVPQMIGTGLGEAIGEAGFSMKRVEIKGARKVPQLQIYNIAFDQPTAAMPLIDLEATRQRLLRFGWVREARVSRRFPDTLVVDIVERKPAAVWQHNQRLALIDMDGVVLEPVRMDAMPDLPIVIGPAANVHASELGRLVDAAPKLQAMMAGASWIGGRRWDIRFQSGEILALPEGEAAARKALATFARMDQATQLLGRGFVRFDMRIPGKFIVRVSNEPGSSVPSIAPNTPPKDAPAETPGTPGIDPAQTI